jgi:hypothetical protein
MAALPTSTDDHEATAYAHWVLARRGVANPTEEQVQTVAARSLAIAFGDGRVRATDLLRAVYASRH